MAPSVDSATTIPVMSVDGNGDPEKGLGSSGKDEPLSEKASAAGPAPATPAIDPPPDGGAQAWRVVLGAFCGLFVSFGWINCKVPCSVRMHEPNKMLTSCRHRSLPRLLPNSPTERVLH